ncbi:MULTISPECIES: hypothetical protein [Paenibacillus]|nr:hypothetical protein [Paenibacillus odorifer]
MEQMPPGWSRSDARQGNAGVGRGVGFPPAGEEAASVRCGAGHEQYI